MDYRPPPEDPSWERARADRISELAQECVRKQDEEIASLRAALAECVEALGPVVSTEESPFTARYNTLVDQVGQRLVRGLVSALTHARKALGEAGGVGGGT